MKLSRPGRTIPGGILKLGLGLLLLVGAGCENNRGQTAAGETALAKNDDYAGSESCKECHEEVYNGWLTTFHVIYYLIFNTTIPFYQRAIMVRPKDAGDMARHLGYIVGLRKTLPPMGRYTWFEKLDYIGVIWGLAVMGSTGLLMLFMDVALKFIPMSWLQTLWAAHSEEAMLATLFLLIIHVYHVHFNPEKFPMTLTWFHGRISREEMEKYHSLELADLEAEEETQAKPASEKG